MVLNYRFIASTLLLSVVLNNAFCQSSQKKPNIVFILADDLGFMDVSLNGSKYYDTPNIDRLAKRGMMFTNAYAASPLCSPTRASILSGQYPERMHFTAASGHLKANPEAPLIGNKAAPWQKVVTPASRNQMTLEEVTIAERLKTNGYSTGFIGKWHVGEDPYSPENQGFDYNIAGGPTPGPPNYFSPYHIKKLPDGPLHEYITDRITDEAIKYIDTRKDSTFFLCLWEFGVHAPYQGKLNYFNEYKGKVDPRGKQDDPIMAAMIKSVDESVGSVMDKLDELKLTDNTIIIFYSDNGGNMYDLIRGKDVTNNFPLKDGKGNIHEGGVKVPAVVSWAGKIKPNSVSNQVISSIDFYPTLLEATNTIADKKQILDGVSLMPVLIKNQKLKRESIFCDFPHYVPATNNYPATSVRNGDWKLIKVYGEGENQEAAFELYNLKDDVGENKNLATKMPDKVKNLDKLIIQHLKDIGGTTPFKNPAYVPNTPNDMGVKHEFPIDKYFMY